MKRNCLFILTMLAVAAPALAQGLTPGSLPEFTENDFNGDGVISVEEATRFSDSATARLIKACDTDQNGRLSQYEYIVCNGETPDSAESRR